MLSNLRIMGLVIGIIGIISVLIYFRGSRWRKSNFIIFSLFNLFLIAISINPDILNILRNLLALEQQERGRILALLIISNLFLWFLILYLKDKQEKGREQYDHLIRALCLRQGENKAMFAEKIKPIMIVIPAFNEEENLKYLIPLMPSIIGDLEVGILIIDDGSDDATFDVAYRYDNCCVIENPINRGGGAALRIGYDVLKKAGVSVCVTMDADGQHKPEDIEKLVSPIIENRFDIVIGSRILGQRESDSKVRLAGLYTFRFIINVLLGTKITDPSSGFRAFKMNKLESIRLFEDQYHTSELIIEAIRKKLRIGEVPITILKRKYGKSKKGKDLIYGFNFAKVIVKTWFRK